MAFKDNRKKTEGELFDLLEGKEKISVQEIITDFPLGIHITGCTTLKNKKGEKISAWTFAEAPKKFFFGGVILTKLAEEWISENGGTAKTCTEALAKEHPGMKLIMKDSASGNRYTDYEILENEFMDIPDGIVEELPFN